MMSIKHKQKSLQRSFPKSATDSNQIPLSGADASSDKNSFFIYVHTYNYYFCIWIYFNIFLQIYLNNRTQIDPVLDKVKAQLNEISGKVAAMIPQAKAAEIKKTE